MRLLKNKSAQVIVALRFLKKIKKMIDLRKLFKKESLKEIPTELEKAWKLGLITEEEFLVLKEKRATEEVKEFYEKQKIKK